MSNNDGGPAFGSGNPTHGGFTGMSLRDWFAGQALAGIMADSQLNCSAALVAQHCYETADAMLKARGGE